MKWLLNRLKWWIAGKEMEELRRWHVYWEEHRRWMSPIPKASEILDSLRQYVDGVSAEAIYVRRDRILKEIIAQRKNFMWGDKTVAPDESQIQRVFDRLVINRLKEAREQTPLPVDGFSNTEEYFNILRKRASKPNRMGMLYAENIDDADPTFNLRFEEELSISRGLNGPVSAARFSVSHLGKMAVTEVCRLKEQKDDTTFAGALCFKFNGEHVQAMQFFYPVSEELRGFVQDRLLITFPPVDKGDRAVGKVVRARGAEYTIEEGDWVVRSSRGEFYAVNGEEFAASALRSTHEA